MDREETVLEMAHRFLLEINEGEMDRALDDGLVLLRLMSDNPGVLKCNYDGFAYSSPSQGR